MTMTAPRTEAPPRTLAEQIRGDAIPLAALSFTRQPSRREHAAHVCRTLRTCGWSARIATDAATDAVAPYWTTFDTPAAV